MSWPPNIGEPLPRAASIWFEQSKLEWILGAEGHAMPEATIKEVRKRSPHGVTCGVQVNLTIGDHSAKTLVSWHYALGIAAPRLVTAYPTP
jgi:hypothetical protein